MDKIIMKGMRFFGRHGVLPQERELGQVFEVDLEIYLDLEAAGATDDMNFTVSYADVFGLVEEVVAGRSCRLIEAVAGNIASLVLERFSRVKKVKVKVKKPSAPVQGLFEYMAVEITRSRYGL
ncbi:MAG: dihydroneopterin aldolase [Peptococcaceae bacterium]|nr:dihydroneopterin aldolase [Peptococcaceae bacterium]